MANLHGQGRSLFLPRFVVAMHPYYIARAFGGFLYLTEPWCICYNVWMTARVAPTQSALAQDLPFSARPARKQRMR